VENQIAPGHLDVGALTFTEKQTHWIKYRVWSYKKTKKKEKELA
jgi:hypothetical protein